VGAEDAIPVSRAWAEIDFEAIRHNLRQAQERVGPDAAVLCTVKADAYGHGAVPVSRCVVRQGAAMLGVSAAAEAVELREAGIDGDILILGAIEPAELAAVFDCRLTPTVSPPDILAPLTKEANRRGLHWPVHLMVDTGMTRAGVPPEHALELARRIAETDSLRLAGVATHFACADGEDQSVTRAQLEEFRRFLACLAQICPVPPLVHVANSSAIFCVPAACFNMVRQGISLYGMTPNPAVRACVELRPALTLKARVLYVRPVPTATPVGYDHTFQTSRPSVIATLGIGYDDGLPRSASNRAEVIIRGQRVPVVGRVSMDYTTVDVTGVPDVTVGDEAVLVGRQAGAAITAEELGEWTGRIPHEVTCALGRRVKRVYLNSRPPEEDEARGAST